MICCKNKKYKMKKLIFCTIFLLTVLIVNAQQNNNNKFRSIELEKTQEKWDSIHNSCKNIKDKDYYGYYDIWSNKVKDNFNFLYDSKIDISFVFTSNDSYDINSLMDVSLDFLCDKFNIVDNTKGSELNRTNLKDAEAKSIYFNGIFKNISSWNAGASLRYIDTDIIIKMKFKENKIKITMTIPYYKYYCLNVLVGNTHENRKIIDYPPFSYKYCNNKPKSNRYKKYVAFYSIAYINSCINCMNITKQFLQYLNTRDIDW